MNYRINPNDYDKDRNPYTSPLSPDPWTKHPHKGRDLHYQPAPKAPTIADLFPRIDRWGIGLLDELTQLKSIADAKPSYPPYNIIRDKALGGRWEICFAVAGFRKTELEVEVQESTLIVRTDPTKDFAAEDIREVIHQGIAQRNFELKFALAEHVEVTSADLKDGILRVILEQNIPEEKLPKSIEIK